MRVPPIANLNLPCQPPLDVPPPSARPGSAPMSIDRQNKEGPHQETGGRAVNLGDATLQYAKRPMFTEVT
jgi:hypothetical protein